VIGVDRAWTLTVNARGEAYIAGTQIWKLNAAGSRFAWSTVLYPGKIRAGAANASGVALLKVIEPAGGQPAAVQPVR
jgi:hypothetical protein